MAGMLMRGCMAAGWAVIGHQHSFLNTTVIDRHHSFVNRAVSDRRHSFLNTAVIDRQHSFANRAVSDRHHSFLNTAVNDRQHSLIVDLQTFISYIYRSVPRHGWYFDSVKLRSNFSSRHRQ